MYLPYQEKKITNLHLTHFLVDRDIKFYKAFKRTSIFTLKNVLVYYYMAHKRFKKYHN